MTRKDFQLIAKTIAGLSLPSRAGFGPPLTTDGELKVVIAVAFAKSLQATNAQFDAERFIAACRAA